MPVWQCRHQQQSDRKRQHPNSGRLQHRLLRLESCFLAASVASQWHSYSNTLLTFIKTIVPPVLWRCWLGGRNGIQPVKNWVVGCGMVICLDRGAHLHMAQLMPLPLTVSCFSKIQTGFTFLVPVHPGSPGQRSVKWACVCVNHISSRTWDHPTSTLTAIFQLNLLSMEIVLLTLLRRSLAFQHLFRNPNVLVVVSNGNAGSKTSLHWNPPVLNGRCWLMHVDLYNGHKIVVVLVPDEPWLTGPT